MSKKGVILGLALAAFAVPFAIPSTIPVAQALPSHETYVYYYSNASKTTQVGAWRSVPCGGGRARMLWGVQTPYTDIFQYECF